MAMVFGAFEQTVSLLFLDDGIYSLINDQQTGQIGFEDFSKSYKSLQKYYDIDNIYVDQSSLALREIEVDTLIIPVTLMNTTQISSLIHTQDVILTI